MYLNQSSAHIGRTWSGLTATWPHVHSSYMFHRHPQGRSKQCHIMLHLTHFYCIPLKSQHWHQHILGRLSYVLPLEELRNLAPLLPISQVPTIPSGHVQIIWSSIILVCLYCQSTKKKISSAMNIEISDNIIIVAFLRTFGTSTAWHMRHKCL